MQIRAVYGCTCGVLGILIALVVTGCESAPPDSSKKAGGAGTSSAQLPAGLIVATAPAGAKDVGDVKKDAKTGDTIVVRGRIGGGQSPFVDGRAVFTLADMVMPPCNAIPEDKCETPWDYCCEEKDRITKLTATVQVVSADGKPLKLGLNGVSSLKPLAEVVVKGRVSQKEDDIVLVIDASEIFVQKPPGS